MSLTIRAFLVAACFTICANAQARTLALYMGSAPGLDLEAALFMRAELQKLLLPAGITVVWKSLADRKAGETFDLLAVSSFEGSCAAGEAVAAPLTASLADTSIVDNRILPFFRIDCTRLMSMLPRDADQAVIGRALARIAAHEIYHIVAQTREHQRTGVAKAMLTNQDLISNYLDLDDSSLSLMRPASLAQTSDLSSRSIRP